MLMNLFIQKKEEDSFKFIIFVLIFKYKKIENSFGGVIYLLSF